MIYFLLGFFICFSLISVILIFIYFKGYIKISHKETKKEIENINNEVDKEFWGNLNCSKYMINKVKK